MLYNVIRLKSAMSEAVKPILETIRDLGRTIHESVTQDPDRRSRLRSIVLVMGSMGLRVVRRARLLVPRLRARLRPIVGFSAGMTLLAGLAFFVWPLLSRTEPETRLINGRLVRESTGWVARVDHEGRVVQVSRTFWGFRREDFVVGQDATIVIRDKEGGLGDLDRGMPVRVAWEKVGDTRRTILIELVVGESTSGRGVPASRSMEASVDESRRTDAVERTPTAAWTPRAKSTVPAVAPATQPALPTPTAPRPELSRPAKPDSPAAAPKLLDPTASDPNPPKARRRDVARKPAPAVESVRTESSPRATEAGSLDGSDAIDWLLENSRRR